jgi:hypothetical protein
MSLNAAAPRVRGFADRDRHKSNRNIGGALADRAQRSIGSQSTHGQIAKCWMPNRLPRRRSRSRRVHFDACCRVRVVMGVPV